MKIIGMAVSIMKVLAIWLADLVNLLHDPFEDFTRPEEPKYFELLSEKAVKFDDDMGTFYWPDWKIYRYILPTVSGDQCLWHGVYTAMWALKNSVTGDHSAQLGACMDGMGAFQLPSGCGSRLIRGWREDGTYEDEVSNDQATGHLLGIYFGWKHGDAHCRDRARTLAAGLADELISHDNALVNADGSPTRYGRLENGHLTDPLNLTLCLAVYRVAYQITSDRRYLDQYDRLCGLYRPLIPYAKVRLLWWDEQPATHRAAIHYSILCDLETDAGLRDRYVRGLLRTWRIASRSANPWVYFLVRRVCLVDPKYLEFARKHLREFTLEDKQRNAERVNSHRVETFRWGGVLRARQPLPRWRVGSQDFFWQRHPYSVDDWVGNGEGNVRYNGGDFLAAYWGLRSLALLRADE